MTTAPAFGPTLAEGWQTLVDGMNIHRWFLVGRPQRAADLAARRDGETMTGPHGWLLHALDPRRVAPVRDVPAAPGPLLVRAGAYRPGPPLPAGPLAGATGLDPLSRDAWALVEGCGLGPLARATVDLLVEVSAEAAADHSVPGTALPAPDALLPAAAVVTDADTAAGRAVRIAGSAALHLLAALLREYAAIEEGRLVPGPVSGGPVPPQTCAGEVIAAAVEVRVLSAAPGVAARLDEARSRLPLLRETVDALHGVVDRTSSEFLTCTVPGPRQFEKYRTGLGMGQG